MALPGVKVNVLNGNLGVQAASPEQSIIYFGCSTDGIPNQLLFHGNDTTIQTTLGLGELPEAASYEISTAGTIVGAMTLPPTTPGGLSAVAHTGTGTGTMTVNSAPHKQITVTVTTTGTLGTAAATFQVGSGPVSSPILLTASYRVPGTYTVLTFPAHTYTALETYTISIVGVVLYAANGSGGTDASVLQASSPIDALTPTVAIVKAGAVGTTQFTFTLDGSVGNISGTVVSISGGKYALPNTGIYITLAGTFVLGDSYSFSSCGPTFTNGDLTAGLALLQTTYLQAVYSMGCVLGTLPDMASWEQQCSTLETAALALFNLGTYVRFFNGAPTLGTITASGGAVVVDITDTDAILEAARVLVSAPHVADCAGDEDLTSVITGLSQRRNNSWTSSARAASVIASENIGFVGLGGVPGVTKIYRDETATPGLDAVGFITMRTFPGNIATGGGLAGFFITNGHTLSDTTSDYYPLTNARLVDRTCTIARANALPYTLSKIPTTTRNHVAGVITETKAQAIDNKIKGALDTALVFTSPADAVATSVETDRTHPLTDGNLIIGVGVQPFEYATFITLNISLVLQA